MRPNLSLLATLLASHFAAALAGAPENARLSAERPVSQAGYVAYSAESGPDLAASPAGAAIVWRDRRSDASVLVAARMNARGELLDRAGIVVAQDLGVYDTLRIWWTGSDYMILWNEGSQIHYRHLTSAGELSELRQLPVTGAIHTLVARGDEALLLVSPDGATILGHIVRAGGSIAATHTIKSANASFMYGVMGAAGSNGYLLAGVTLCNNDVACKMLRTMALDERGAVITTTERLFEGLLSEPRMTIASAGSEYAVFVAPHAPTGGLLLYRFSERAEQLGSPIHTGLRSQYAASAVYREGHYELAWRHDVSDTERLVQTARITTLGRVAGHATTIDGADAGRPLLQTNGSATYLVTTPGAVYAGRIEPGAQTLVAVELSLVSAAAAKQWNVRTATSGEQTLIVWVEGLWPRLSLKAARMKEGGIAGQTMTLSEGEVSGAAVATDGLNFLVTWRGGYSQLRGTIVRADGTAGSLLAFEESYADASTVWNGSEYVIFTIASVITVDASGAIVSRAAAPYRPHSNHYLSNVFARFSDGRYVVVTGEEPPCNITCPMLPASIYVWHFDRALQPIAAPVLLVDDRFAQLADVAINGSTSAVLWTEESDANGPRLFAQRIATDGSRVDAMPVELSRNVTTSAAIISDRGGFAFSFISLSGDEKHLTFGRLAESVTSLPLGRLGPRDATRQYEPMALFRRPAGRYTIVYPRFAPEPDIGGVQQLYTREISTALRRRPVSSLH